MTCVNGTSARRILVYANNCPTAELGQAADAFIVYNAKANVTSGGVSGKYSVQGNFTVKGSDGNWYWVQDVVEWDGVSSNAEARTNIWRLNGALLINNQFGTFSSSTFQNLGTNAGNDLIELKIDLSGGTLYAYIIVNGVINTTLSYTLPSYLVGGTVFDIEALPTGYAGLNATFSSPSSFKALLHASSETIPEWYSVINFPLNTGQNAPCTGQQAEVTGEDCNLNLSIQSTQPADPFVYTLTPSAGC